MIMGLKGIGWVFFKQKASALLGPAKNAWGEFHPQLVFDDIFGGTCSSVANPLNLGRFFYFEANPLL